MSYYGWWPGPGGYYGKLTDPVAFMWFMNPKTLTSTPVDLQGYVPPQYAQLAPAWSEEGELFLLVQSGDVADAVLEVVDGKATAIKISTGWSPVPHGSPTLLVGPEALIVTTNGAGPHSLVRLLRP